MVNGSIPEDILEADHILFWHSFSVPYMKHMHHLYPELPLDMISPPAANWILRVFSQIRYDLNQLGMGPFDCYRMLSSGAHGVILSALLCDRVDLYGFR